MTDSIPGDPAPAPAAAQPSPPPPPPPPPPPAGSRPPLVRSATDRYIAGVCGGLGAHFEISPTIFRLAFVALTVAGGFGVLIYIAAWILMPRAGSNQRMGWNPPLPNDRHTILLVVAGLLVVLAVVMLAGSAHVGHGGLFLGVVLLGIGVVLLLQDRQRPATHVTAAATSSPSLAYAGGAFATPSAATPTGAWIARVPTRPHSILGLLTVAAALLAVGVAALLDAAGVVSVTIAAGAAIALIIVGAGLVAGAWFGRSRALIALGSLLIPFTAATALVDEPLNAGTGRVVVAPQSLSDLRSEYHLAAGQLTVDLSQIPSSATSTVLATVAFGNLTVVVPPQENLSITAHAGAGRIDILGAVDGGINIDSPANRSSTTSGGTLHLTLRVGFGEIQVVEPGNVPVAPQ